MINNNINKDMGRMLRQHRLIMELTIRQLAAASGVSSSHLSRIEKGERFPSASVLQKIAKPLGFEENELFTLAGYLSPGIGEEDSGHRGGQLDPYVASVLSQEPIEVQRVVIGIINILRSMIVRQSEPAGGTDCLKRENTNRQRRKTMIKTAIRFQDSTSEPEDYAKPDTGMMVMVFDKNGEQIPEYQGRYREVRQSILRDAPAEAMFAHGVTDAGELQEVSREEW